MSIFSNRTRAFAFRTSTALAILSVLASACSEQLASHDTRVDLDAQVDSTAHFDAAQLDSETHDAGPRRSNDANSDVAVDAADGSSSSCLRTETLHEGWNLIEGTTVGAPRKMDAICGDQVGVRMHEFIVPGSGPVTLSFAKALGVHDREYWSTLEIFRDVSCGEVLQGNAGTCNGFFGVSTFVDVNTGEVGGGVPMAFNAVGGERIVVVIGGEQADDFDLPQRAEGHYGVGIRAYASSAPSIASAKIFRYGDLGFDYAFSAQDAEGDITAICTRWLQNGVEVRAETCSPLEDGIVLSPQGMMEYHTRYPDLYWGSDLNWSGFPNHNQIIASTTHIEFSVVDASEERSTLMLPVVDSTLGNSCADDFDCHIGLRCTSNICNTIPNDVSACAAASNATMIRAGTPSFLTGSVLRQDTDNHDACSSSWYASASQGDYYGPARVHRVRVGPVPGDYDLVVNDSSVDGGEGEGIYLAIRRECADPSTLRNCRNYPGQDPQRVPHVHEGDEFFVFLRGDLFQTQIPAYRIPVTLEPHESLVSFPNLRALTVENRPVLLALESAATIAASTRF